MIEGGLQVVEGGLWLGLLQPLHGGAVIGHQKGVGELFGRKECEDLHLCILPYGPGIYIKIAGPNGMDLDRLLMGPTQVQCLASLRNCYHMS